jgi:hypothetical protein
VVYTPVSTYSYAMPLKQWQKLQPHMLEIFMTIDASKQ